MRMTVEFDPDTAEVVEQLPAEHGRGISDAVNELIRRSQVEPFNRPAYVPQTRPLGLSLDVSNVAGALDVLDGPESR